MSENNRKPTLAEEFGFENERMTIEEIIAMEAEEDEDLEDLPLSKYAKMWANYMEEEHPARKSFLILEGIWQETLQEVSTEAREMAQTLTDDYYKQFTRPKDDYMATVQYEYKLQAHVEEIIMRDIVYKER